MTVGDLKGLENILVIIAATSLWFGVACTLFLGAIFFKLRGLLNFFREQSQNDKNEKSKTINNRVKNRE